MSTAIEFENISKQYRLGLVSTRTLSHDLNRWWTMNVLGKEDPYLRIGETNDRSVKGASDYVWALKDIDFKVEQGDVVGIIGRNGAGKSTLLKLLSRVTAPTTGQIRARGRIGSLLEVGTGFHPEMTGRENIYMNGAILGMTRAEVSRKLDEIVDFSGCERYLDTPVKRYSSGMMVRLGFAVAAHLDPEILVVDEVLAVGDAEFQKKAIGKMKDVSQGEGRTVLFVSHNMDSILNLCNSGVLLNKGSVEFSGSAADTVEHYLTAGDSAFVYGNPSPKSPLFVSKMSFGGNERQQRGEFLFDESVELLVDFKRESQYSVDCNCIFGVTLYNKGKKVCTVEHCLYQLNDSDHASLSIKFPSSLFSPGNYCFEFAIHIPNVCFIDHMTDVCKFTIMDNGSSHLKYNGVDCGMIVLNPEMNFTI